MKSIRTLIVLSLTIYCLSSGICFSSNGIQTNLFNNFYLYSNIGIRVLTEHSAVAIGAGDHFVPSKSPNEAFLYSLAIPGMGQLYTGAKHGYIYTAAEVGLLAAYFILRNNAVKTRDDYRDVVKENVIFVGPGSFETWDPIEDFEHATQYENWNHVYDSEATRNRTGKWYWKDLDPSLKNEEDSTIEFDSKYRLEAYNLRQKANDTFQTARTALGAVILNHLLSAVEARITTKRWINKQQQKTHLDLDVKTNISTGALTGTLVLQKKF